LRARELRDMSDEELVKRLAESRENLFNLRFP
jgi:ribosomal protein L29